MAITIETEAFHHLIKTANKAHFLFNQGNLDASRLVLAQLKEVADSIIHHLHTTQHSVNGPKAS